MNSLCRLKTRDHRRHALGICIGAVRRQGAVQGRELVIGLRPVAEQRIAERAVGGPVSCQIVGVPKADRG